MRRFLIRGRIIYFLAILIIVQFSYPFTSSGSALSLVIYQFMFAAVIATAFLLDRERWYRITISTGVIIFLVTSIIYALNTNQIWDYDLDIVHILVLHC